MDRTHHRPSIIISPSACLTTAVVVLLLPLGWVAAWVLATFVHELSHYLAIRGFKIPVYTIRLGTAGIHMETGPMSYPTEFICTIAGPLGALLLLPIAKIFPGVAICAYVQTLYNLMPVYPLDGGRALRCILMHLFSSVSAQRICNIVEIHILCILILLGFWTSFHLKLGIIPIIAALILLLKRIRIKIPCKDSKLRVQ